MTVRKCKLGENCALLDYYTMSGSDSLTNISREPTGQDFKGQASLLLRDGSLKSRKPKSRNVE